MVLRIAGLAVLIALAAAPAARAQFALGEARRLHDLARQLGQAGQLDEAAAAASEGLARCNDEGPRRLACTSALSNVAGALATRRGAVADAVLFQRQSVHDGLLAFGPKYPVMIARFQWLGRALLAAGKPDEAEQAFQQELLGAEAAGQPVDKARALNDLVNIRSLAQRWSESLPLAVRAEALLRTSGDTASEDYAAIAAMLARTLIALGGQRMAEDRFAEAVVLLRDAATLTSKTRGAADPAYAQAVLALANARFKAGDPAGAEADLATAPALDATPSLARAAASMLRVGIADRLGRPEAAVAAITRAEADLAATGASRNADWLRTLANAAIDGGHFVQAAPLLDRAEAAASTDTMRAVLANARGLLLYNLSRYTEAADQFSRSLALGAATLPQRDRAYMMINLASMRRREGRLAETEKLLQDAMALLPLAQADDDLGVAEALHGLALARLAADRLDEAAALERQALAVRERLAPGTRAVALSLDALASIFEAHGASLEAEAPRRRALAISMAAQGASHPDTASQMRELAGTLEMLGRTGEARPLRRRALAIDTQVFGADDPNVQLARGELEEADGDRAAAGRDVAASLAVQEQRLGAGHPVIIPWLRRLARIAAVTDRPALADSLLVRAIAIRERAGGGGLADLLLQRGDSAYYAGDLAAAEPLLVRALAAQTQAAGRSLVLSALGRVAVARGQDEAAEAWFGQAFTQIVETLGPDCPPLALPLSGQADLAERRGEAGAALALRQRALLLATKGDDRPGATAWLLTPLVGQLARAGQLDAAAAAADRLEQALPGSDARTLAAIAFARAGLLAAQHRDPEAEAATQRAMLILRSAGGDSRATMARGFNNLGLLAQRLRPRTDDAEAMFNQALELAQAALGDDHPDLAPILANLASRLAARGADAEARAALARALSLSRGRAAAPERWL